MHFLYILANDLNKTYLNSTVMQHAGPTQLGSEI